jgi:hypothetical protein
MHCDGAGSGDSKTCMHGTRFRAKKQGKATYVSRNTGGFVVLYDIY